MVMKALRLIMSLFLVLATSSNALALHVMYPHISKDVKMDMPKHDTPRVVKHIRPKTYLHETQALRGISPTENIQFNSSPTYKTRPLNLRQSRGKSKNYFSARDLEREMAMELEARRAKRRGIEFINNDEEIRLSKAMDRTKKKIEIIEKRKKDKALAKEARYAKKAHPYIFDPPNFMKGLLGERVGLGHTYLQQGRPGLTRSYEETDGFRLVRMFDWIGPGVNSIDAVGVAGRAEFGEETFPLESFILDAKKIDVIRFGRWETREQYRSQIMPITSKAFGLDTYFTYGNLPKFTFTYDYREIYHQYQALYGSKDWDIKTYEFKIEDSRKWYPIGYVTLIPGFKYQIYDSEDSYSGPWSSSNEHRDEYFMEMLWAPSGVTEFYTKVDAYKANFHDIGWKYSPWHWGVRGEVRKKYLPWRLSGTFGYAHSFVKGSPFENFFRKEEAYLDFSKEVTGRLHVTSRWEFIYGQITEDDNQAPTYDTFNPYEADAKVLNVKNGFQYQLVKNIYLKSGFNTATGFGFDEFNNFALFSELEYYNAGYFRCNFGYKYTDYYHLADELGTVYFKCFFFM